MKNRFAMPISGHVVARCGVSELFVYVSDSGELDEFQLGPTESST